MKKQFIIIFVSVFCITAYTKAKASNITVQYNKLTPEEESVIINKGTERPFTGKYNNHYEKGVYYCKRCSAPLFKSEQKFESSCGWPSFDDAIDGAIEEIPDPDGIRTEIVCANCKAHLGHVFRGERFTPKNLRHCVNSISLNFTPLKNTETAYFAGGCFWGVEHFFEKEKGVLSVTSGYMGGSIKNPTYKQVCTGSTGHAETVEVVFNPNKTSFEKLAKLFFEIHDQAQINRQGPDIGTQYRSEIFYTNDNQKKISKKLIKILKSKNFKVATKITQADNFYKGEDYHQDYYKKTGKEPYCHFQTKKFD